MAIYSYDIVSTLQALGMMKYWKGKHIVLKKQVSPENGFKKDSPTDPYMFLGRPGWVRGES